MMDDDCSFLDNGRVWDGITKYCYDCIQIPNCGYLLDQQSCITGNETMPFDTSTTTASSSSSWYYDSCPVHNKKQKISGYLSVFFMILYLLAFGIGMGGMPWTINSEIFSLQYRSDAVSITTATNWIGNLVVSATFLSISKPDSLTAYGAFWLYSSVAFFGFIWLYFVLPETKGLPLEEIEKLFGRGSTNDGYDKVLCNDVNSNI